MKVTYVKIVKNVKKRTLSLSPGYILELIDKRKGKGPVKNGELAQLPINHITFMYPIKNVSPYSALWYSHVYFNLYLYRLLY